MYVAEKRDFEFRRAVAEMHAFAIQTVCNKKITLTRGMPIIK